MSGVVFDVMKQVEAAENHRGEKTPLGVVVWWDMRLDGDVVNSVRERNVATVPREEPVLVERVASEEGGVRAGESSDVMVPAVPLVVVKAVVWYHVRQAREVLRENHSHTFYSLWHDISIGYKSKHQAKAVTRSYMCAMHEISQETWYTCKSVGTCAEYTDDQNWIANTVTLF
jgi:hypothetical protein